MHYLYHYINNCPHFSSFSKIELISDGKTTILFAPTRSVVPFPGPARNPIFNFRPVWARKTLLSPMFLNMTTNYLVLTDIGASLELRLEGGVEYSAKYYSTET